MQIASTANDVRQGKLIDLLSAGRLIQAIEVHNPISAIIAENARVEVPEENGRCSEFDVFWSSSLTDSTLRGLPDIEVLDARSRLANIDDIFSVTTKPLIMDGDTGGRAEHFEFNIREMERRGVSAVIIEDKRGLKRNSLLPGGGHHELASVEEFCEKIRRGKAAQRSKDFLIFARIEALIVGLGVPAALERADAYLDAGADGIMIHSRERSPAEVLEFAREFRRRHPAVPLISVPTTYHDIHASDLAEAGFNVVIYANHMLRAALKAMREVSTSILRNGRTSEAEALCLDLGQVLQLGR